MIARDHHRPDTCGFRPGDGFSRLVAGRVDHADESREHEVAFDTLVDILGAEGVGRKIPVRNAQGAQRTAGEFLVRLENLQSARRRSTVVPRRPHAHASSA